MFVVLLDYSVPADQLEHLRPQHIGWLEAQYERGLLIGSGRQVPRVGGVLLFADVDRGQVDEALQQEPFIREGLARPRVTQFVPTRGPLLRLGRDEPGLAPDPTVDRNDSS